MELPSAADAEPEAPLTSLELESEVLVLRVLLNKVTVDLVILLTRNTVIITILLLEHRNQN